MKVSGNKLRAVRHTGLLLAGVLCGAQAQEPATAASEQPPAVEAAAPAAEPAVTETAETIAVAQTAEPAPAAKADAKTGEEPTRLDDVVVTATKRATPVRKIAGTVNVLTGENLEREGVQNIEQIVQLVPGVNLTDDGTGGSAKRVTIRGISTGFGVNPTAGTLLGDIPFSDPFSPKVQLDPNPFDMATVEVLKGPQGTLFGGTGLNGLIRYVPEEPQLDEFRVKYYGQLMSYPGNGGSAWNYGAAVNAPFADHTAAVRVVAFHRAAPGYTDDVTHSPGKKDVNTLGQYGARGMLTWLPAEHWKISLMGTAQHTTEDDVAFTDNYRGELSRNDSARASPQWYSYALGNLGIQREFEWGDLISQTSYFKKNFDTWLEASRSGGDIVAKLPILSGADIDRIHGLTEEVRAVSAPSDSPWKWLAGAFFYKLHLYDCANIGALGNLPDLQIQFPQLLAGVLPNACPGNVSKLNGQLNITNLIADVDLQENALFGEVTRQLGEYWEATLGARAYRTQSGGTVTTAGALYVSQNHGLEVARENAVDERGLSPKGSIVFHPTEDVRSYLTVSRGFRFGGIQIAASTPTTNVPEVYKSDSLWNYELGLRTDWLDRTLRWDTSVYHIEWKNPQVFQVSADRLVNFITNVGGARGDGVESNLRYLFPFAPGLSIDVTGAWNRTVTTVPFQSSTGALVPAGSQWPLAPRWQTSTTLAYAVPVETWQAGASLRHTYMSTACNAIECAARIFNYTMMDANVFASGPEGSGWPQLSLSVNNLTDRRGVVSVTPGLTEAGLVVGSDSVVYLAPRALVLRLSGSF